MLSGAAILLPASEAIANPQGATVVGGSATISSGPGVTTIDQGSQRAIINWQSFSIGAGETTRFRQPGKDAISLNRVTGKQRSDLFGSLQGNGHVWVVNPNGVLIGPSARIDVNGFLATTSDILDTDFMAGHFNFSVPSPDPDASVINQGLISIGEAGLAALVAPHVRNDGVIVGRLGQVVLAGAPTFTVDLQGDGLIQFEVTSAVVDGLDGQGALVDNRGTIRTEGGRVLLTASAAAGVVEEVINTEGIIEAHSIAARDGAIILAGGDHGTVRVAGTLDASGATPEAEGGSIDVLGEHIDIAGGATLLVSGEAGGGSVHVGGDAHGQGERQRAKTTTVAKSARINADATGRGEGGDIVVWADQAAAVEGSLSARGGPKGGDGGFIETSSKGRLEVTADIDASAPNGRTGTWLIDPDNVEIVDSLLPPPPPDTAFVLASIIERARADILINAPQAVTVSAPITWSTAYTLSLIAGTTLAINAPIDHAPGKIVMRGSTIQQSANGILTAAALQLQPADASSTATLTSDNRVQTLAAGPTSSSSPLKFANINYVNAADLTVDAVVGRGVAAQQVDVTAFGRLAVNEAIGGGSAVRLRANSSSANPGEIALNAPVAVSDSAGTVRLTANRINQTAGGTIIAPTLGIVGTSGSGAPAEIALTAANQVANVALVPDIGATLGSVQVRNARSVAFVGGVIDATDFSTPTLGRSFRFDVTGRFDLNKPIEATGAGTSILITSDSFSDNTTGANGLDAGTSGRFLVYAATLDPNTDGRDLSVPRRYSFPFDPHTPIPDASVIPANQDYYLYGFTPTLTLTATGQPREYGDPNALFIANQGLLPGDTLAAALTAIPAATAPMATESANVGSYGVGFSFAPVASDLGYAVVSNGGTFEITPAPLLYSLGSFERVVGQPNPDFTAGATYSGFKRTDTVASLLSPTFIDQTGTVLISGGAGGPLGAGLYSILIRQWQNQNYTPVASTPGTLLVQLEPRPINPLSLEVTIQPVIATQGESLATFAAPPVPTQLAEPPRQVMAPPPAPQRVRRSAKTMLFANDGNRDLWTP